MAPRRLLSALIGAALVAAPLANAQAAPTDSEVCASAAEEAQNLKKDGKLTAAREKLIVCARPVCPAFVKNDCTKWLDDVEKSLPSVVIKAVDGKGKDLTQVRVTVDGTVVTNKLDGRAILVDPGEHQVKYESEGAAPVTDTVLVRQGEVNRILSVTFGAAAPAAPAAPPPGPAAPQPEPERPASGGKSVPTASWILGGAGLVAVGVGAVFWASGKGDHSDMESGCAKTQTCPKEDVDAAKTKLMIGDVAVGVGVVAIGAAVVLAVVSKPAPAASSAIVPARAPARRFDVAPIAGGAVASFGARF